MSYLTLALILLFITVIYYLIIYFKIFKVDSKVIETQEVNSEYNIEEDDIMGSLISDDSFDFDESDIDKEQELEPAIEEFEAKTEVNDDVLGNNDVFINKNNENINNNIIFEEEAVDISNAEVADIETPIIEIDKNVIKGEEINLDAKIDPDVMNKLKNIFND